MKQLNPINVKDSKVYKQLSCIMTGLELDYHIAEVLKQEPMYDYTDERTSELAQLFTWEMSSLGHKYWYIINSRLNRFRDERRMQGAVEEEVWV